ncbi:hypothetical protein [Leifsonia sp. SIMBA_070]
MCKQCGLVEFVPNTLLDRDDAAPEEPRRTSRRRPHRLARVRRLPPWAAAHRVSLTLVAVLGTASAGMVAAAILR